MSIPGHVNDLPTRQGRADSADTVYLNPFGACLICGQSPDCDRAWTGGLTNQSGPKVKCPFGYLRRHL
jgi:hypothetical protein